MENRQLLGEFEMNPSDDPTQLTVSEVLKYDSSFFRAVGERLKKDSLTACYAAERVAQTLFIARLTSSHIADVLIVVTKEGWTRDDHETGTPENVVDAMRMVVVATLGKDSVHENDVIYVLKHDLTAFCWNAHLEEEHNWLARLNHNRVAHALAEVTQPNRTNADLISTGSKP
jgi:hypothetical protein